MNGLITCSGCGHGIVEHGDTRCGERGCRCDTSHQAALELEVGRVRSVVRVRHAMASDVTELSTSDSYLARLVRELRVERGWSQSRLAVVSGVERTTLQRIETGKRGDPGFSIVVRLARAFDVNLESFTGPLSADDT